MPELPEVETVVSDLRPVLPGAVFTGLDARHLGSIWPSIDKFEELRGLKVESVARRGKFIVIFFENEKVVTIHLRMTGRLILENLEDPDLPFERTRLDFDRGSLRFCDMRKFGKVWLSELSDYEQDTGIWKLGVEPLEDDFTSEKFKELLSGRRGVVKKWLLDQTVIAGIGNIYADEACFYAGIRPDTEMKKLDEEKLELLHQAVVRALKQGVENRGTSISDYADAYGKSGKNQELLYVYGKGGKKCFECGTTLTKIKLVGRGTVFCENCQE